MSEPWTDDPVLREYHFTNVHRHKDPGTRWIVDYVGSQGLEEPLDVLFSVFAYRGLNRVETFERHGLPTRDAVDLALWLAEMAEARDRGEVLGSGRHLTYYARLQVTLPALVEDHEVADAVWSCETAFDAIRTLSSARLAVGPFFGTQIVADLVTIEPPGLTLTRDVMVPTSGGSLYSLELIEGSLDDVSASRFAYDERTTVGRRARNLLETAENESKMRRLLATQPSSLSEPLTLIDLEHSLCEYSRYTRLRAGDLTRASHMRRR